jgi:hypothetical protein
MKKIGIILICISFISGTVYFFIPKKKTKVNEQNCILSIVQTGPKKEALKTMYLSQLLELSIDKPTQFSNLKTKQAQEKLLKSPLIKSVIVKKQKPNSIYIDYTLREPIAWLCDYENVAIDENGYLFPVSPFLSPKKLPSLYLGIDGFGEKKEDNKRYISWDMYLQDEHYNLAIDVFNIITQPEIKNTFKLKRIDVSRAFCQSYGKREIILTIEEEMVIKTKERSVLCVFPKILRLNAKDYAQQLGNYLVLRRKILDDYKKQIQIEDFQEKEVVFSKRVIDFRIPKLAFIDEF